MTMSNQMVANTLITNVYQLDIKCFTKKIKLWWWWYYLILSIIIPQSSLSSFVDLKKEMILLLLILILLLSANYVWYINNIFSI